jgi:hypothetical protein
MNTLFVMEVGISVLVPFDILHLLDLEFGEDLLTRQAFALTCKAAYKVCGKLSRGIIDLLPEKWRDFRNHDPCVSYYFPLLYRVLREAPAWLYAWEIGSAKKVYAGLPMVLSVSFFRPRGKSGTQPYASYFIENNGRGWTFASSSKGIAYKVHSGKPCFIEADCWQK